VCEPPGEPYYLCRIMEFLHTKSDDPKSPVDSIRVNWFYRPRDVQRLSSDSRLIYGTMHSDVCPLTSLRGKCQILHRSEFDNLDEYRKGKGCFWFSQIFDRFIRFGREVEVRCCRDQSSQGAYSCSQALQTLHSVLCKVRPMIVPTRK
jgi:hypothetical protein